MPAKQIVYKLEDYAGSGGLISTNFNDMTIALDESLGENDELRMPIDDWVFEKGGFTRVRKIGIQAPPGTKFRLVSVRPNADESSQPISTDMIIGRSGIYELEVANVDLDIQFSRPKKYVLDVELSTERRNDGRNAMESAKNQFDATVKDLYSLYDTAVISDSNTEFWEKYQIAHKEYVDKYNIGRSLYLEGINGVYIETVDYNGLRNIIIDFVYEEIGEDA